MSPQVSTRTVLDSFHLWFNCRISFLKDEGHWWFGLVWFLYLMAYQTSWFILYQSHPCRRTVVVLFEPIAKGSKRVHTFPKGIRPKVNIIKQLESELAYTDVTVLRFSHYPTGTTTWINGVAYLSMCFRVIGVSSFYEEGLKSFRADQEWVDLEPGSVHSILHVHSAVQHLCHIVSSIILIALLDIRGLDFR